MNRSMRGSRLFLIGTVFLSCTTTMQAQQYLFTNDNVANHTNSTTALRVAANGAVKRIATYSTGGKSTGGNSYFALSPIVSAQTTLGSCLFVSNGGNSTIAAFQINLFKGTLAPVPGSPFSYGLTGAQEFGIGLASRGGLLFAGNTSDNSISVLKINSECALKHLNTLKVAASPTGLKVSPNGQYLIAAYMGEVDSFSIDHDTEQLTELGPFPAKGAAASVEISCDSSTVYFGDAAAHTQVEVFSLSSSGHLTEINNFTNNNGVNSNNVMLSADGDKLYVSNTQSRQITTLKTGSHGALSYDKTTNLKGKATYVLGLATVRNGSRIFVSEQSNEETIGVLSVNGNTLKEVSASPFSVLSNGGDPAGMIALPTKVCAE
jgi:6-phosphogluconolactonase (cycloisomerase 2 family)